MLTGALLVLYNSTNSSFAPLGPRNRNSLITTGLTDPDPPEDCAVPVSDTTAEFGELPMLSVALFVPADVGLKVTLTVVEPPAASVVTPGEPTTNWLASVPLSVNGVVNVTFAPLTLLMVMRLTADPPTGTLPKSNDVGVAVMPEAPPIVKSESKRGNS